jgi:hypothetical protein
VERAKFIFPRPDELRSVSTTDVSQFEVGSTEKEWKAALATIFFNIPVILTLKDTLGDPLLAAGSENYLLARFSPRLQVDEEGNEDEVRINKSTTCDPRARVVHS